MDTISPLRLACLWIALLTVLRIATLWTTGLELSGDEAQYWSWAQELDWGYFTKPPLIAWTIAATTSLCGDGVACVKLGSPLLHAVTALALYHLGKQIAGEKVGLRASVLWITLPSVSFSSMIVSTDVPLLACWSVAVLSARKLIDGPSWRWVIIGGVALGLGLLAKYAMAYLVVGLALHLVITPEARGKLLSRYGLVVLGVAGVLLLPNILWNIANEFATVGHLKDNANLKAAEMFRPLGVLKFWGEQVGVLAPIPFAILIWRLIAWARGGIGEKERFLLLITLPPLIVVTAQAFLSRANANWAVTAFPTAIVLVSWWIVERGPRWLRWWTVAPHVVLGLILMLAIALWPNITPPVGERALSRASGWQKLSAELRPILVGQAHLPVLMSDRKEMALALYYLRDQLGSSNAPEGRQPVWMFDWNGVPEHHYELANRYDASKADPALLLTNYADPGQITNRFQTARHLQTLKIISHGRTRRMEVWIVEGFKG